MWIVLAVAGLLATWVSVIGQAKVVSGAGQRMDGADLMEHRLRRRPLAHGPALRVGGAGHGGGDRAGRDPGPARIVGSILASFGNLAFSGSRSCPAGDLPSRHGHDRGSSGHRACSTGDLGRAARSPSASASSASSPPCRASPWPSGSAPPASSPSRRSASRSEPLGDRGRRRDVRPLGRVQDSAVPATPASCRWTSPSTPPTCRAPSAAGRALTGRRSGRTTGPRPAPPGRAYRRWPTP